MSPPAASPAPWIFWLASQVVHDPPPSPHVKITEGDLRSVQTQPEVPSQEHGLQLNICSFLRSSNFWHRGRCSSLGQRGQASGPSSASSQVWHMGQVTWPLWSIALTSVEQELELWFIRSLLELIDVSLYCVIQVFHLFFPMLNWFLICYCCLVKATPSVIVSPKTLFEQQLFVLPLQHCQTIHNNLVWDIST